MTRKQAIWTGAGVIALMAITAGASAFVTQRSMTEEPKPKVERITWNEPQRAPQPQQQVQQAQPACDDANIVGAAVGAVAGGVVGNQFGSGKGKDLATIGGAIGGGWLGKDHIPTRNVLCP